MTRNQISRRDFVRLGILSSAYLAASGLLTVPQTTAEAATRNYNLSIGSGTKTLIDNTTAFMFSYSDDGTLKVPGPVLVVNEGDAVSVTVTNNRSESHNFFIPGVTAQTTIAPGASYTYNFTAPAAGTYLYYDSLSAVNREMGLYGAMIVMPAGGSNAIWAEGPTFNQQYLWLYSDIDNVNWNPVVQNGGNVNTSVYKPNYFFLNGLGFNQTLNNPGTLTSGHITGTNGQNILVRMANASLVPQSIHYHGYHPRQWDKNGTRFSVPLAKDTFLLNPLDTVNVIIPIDQTGDYVVHPHIAMADTANGADMKGAISLISIT